MRDGWERAGPIGQPHYEGWASPQGVRSTGEQGPSHVKRDPSVEQWLRSTTCSETILDHPLASSEAPGQCRDQSFSMEGLLANYGSSDSEDERQEPPVALSRPSAAPSAAPALAPHPSSAPLSSQLPAPSTAKVWGLGQASWAHDQRGGLPRGARSLHIAAASQHPPLRRFLQSRTQVPLFSGIAPAQPAKPKAAPKKVVVQFRVPITYGDAPAAAGDDDEVRSF